MLTVFQRILNWKFSRRLFEDPPHIIISQNSDYMIFELFIIIGKHNDLGAVKLSWLLVPRSILPYSFYFPINSSQEQAIRNIVALTRYKKIDLILIKRLLIPSTI